jgi:hypothetical protein
MAAWSAAGVVFYVLIYRPAEARKAQEREKAVLVIENHSRIGKGARRSDPQ